jgi:hypothetical protein
MWDKLSDVENRIQCSHQSFQTVDFNFLISVVEIFYAGERWMYWHYKIKRSVVKEYPANYYDRPLDDLAEVG